MNPTGSKPDLSMSPGRTLRLIGLGLVILSLATVAIVLGPTLLRPKKEYPVGQGVIKMLQVDIQVHRDNVYQVTELITIDFPEPTRVFMREIPNLYNGIRRKVTEIAVTGGSGNYQNITKTRSSVMVEIMRLTQTLQGEHTFVIEYRFDMGSDKNKGLDNFHWPITSGIYSVENLFFSLELPEVIDNKALEFTVEGSPARVWKDIAGSEVTGGMLGQLDPGKAFIISVELPDGCFKWATKYIHPMLYWAGGLTLLLVVAGLYIIKRARLRPTNSI